MIENKSYTDIRGRLISLASLDDEERQLLQVLRKLAEDHPNWNDYSNLWLPRVAEFYEKRGLSRRETRDTVAYRIGQDLGSRMAVAAGLARLPDYRDELDELIRTHFSSRRQFCDATGIAEDMLSHVLARRKHLAIQTLVEALDRIGFGLHISPLQTKKVS